MLWDVNTALKNISLILRRSVLLVMKKEYPEKKLSFCGKSPTNLIILMLCRVHLVMAVLDFNSQL